MNEAELIAAGTHVMCKCHNAILITANYCPYCKQPNMANSAATCPTCGKPFKEH